MTPEEKREKKYRKLKEWRDKRRENGTLPKYKLNQTPEEKAANKEQYKEKMKSWRASEDGIASIKRMADSKRKFATLAEYKKYWAIENRRRCATDLKACFRDKLAQSKKRARIKGLEFSITLDDLFEIYTPICPYLGIEMTLCNKENPQYSLTIDRIDNSRGYTRDNIQIISHRANMLKNNVPIEELHLFLENMKPRHKRKNKLVQPEEAMLIEEKK